MNRKYISLFFSLIFMLCIVAPSILYMVDNDKDFYVMVDITDEENKENEMTKDFEIKFLEIASNSASHLDLLNDKSHNFYLKLHSMYHADNTSPPPELI